MPPDSATAAHPGYLDRLRAQHPLWDVRTNWTASASGPDTRLLVASRDGLTVSAWTPAGLAREMADAEVRHGWPCRLGGPPVRQV